MNPTISWTIANDVSMNELKQRFLEIVKSLLEPSVYALLEPLPDSTINFTCIKMFKNLAPKGFTFGFHNQSWTFYRETLDL